MPLRDKIIWFFCVILAAGLLVAAGAQLDYINSQRQEMKLISNEPLENAPPALAFATVAMGAFRGLVVDFLWVRADRLKMEGQFFDAKQLAEWITVLQPRFSAVWQFQAWNMAYNISVAIPATHPDQRWNWVKNGYEMLRDQGIEINPKSVPLYRELARIFQHKIGAVQDDAHKYYKLQLAEAMEPLLGTADNEYFQALTNAPSDWLTIKNDPNFSSLIEQLISADPIFADDDDFVNNFLALRQSPDKFEPAAFEVRDKFRGSDILKKFDIFANAYHLRKVWKFDPALMEQLNKTYGPPDYNDPNLRLPMDWRIGDTHAIYWALRGLEVAAENRQEEISTEEANTDRIVNHSLQNLFRNGKMFIYKLPAKDGEGQKREVFLRSDLRMFEPYNRSVMAVLEKYKQEGGSTYVSFQHGHRNMLVNALFSFYQAGHVDKAEKIYRFVQENYPKEDFEVPFIVFVKNRLRKELTNIGVNNAKEIVQMMLREGYFRYAIGEDDQAFSREKMAREVYDHYQSAYRDENRINLPDFKLLRYFALLDFFNDQYYPANLRRSLLGRIKIERPDLARQFEYLETEMIKQQSQESQKQ